MEGQGEGGRGKGCKWDWALVYKMIGHSLQALSTHTKREISFMAAWSTWRPWTITSIIYNKAALAALPYHLVRKNPVNVS